MSGFRATTSGALIAAGAGFLVGSLPANGRWTIHNGNDVTQITDGNLNRLYVFSPAATGITCGQTSVTLTGQTTGGTHVLGTDSIRTWC